MEVARVTKPGGVFLLNISDCIRNRLVVPVVDRHANICQTYFSLEDTHEIKTPRMGYGANGKARVDTEVILIFRRKHALSE